MCIRDRSFAEPSTDRRVAFIAASTWHGTPDAVDALLRAGASVHGAGVRFPSGYAEVDALLRSHGA